MYEDVPTLVFLAPTGYYSKHGQTICKMKYKSEEDMKVLVFFSLYTHTSISYTFSGHSSSIFPFALTYTAFKLRPVVLICQDTFVFKAFLLFGTYCLVYAGFILNRVRTNAVDWGRCVNGRVRRFFIWVLLGKEIFAFWWAEVYL